MRRRTDATPSPSRRVLDVRPSRIEAPKLHVVLTVDMTNTGGVLMRAIAVTEFGSPDALHTVELPEPSPGVGEARIRVAAATVNPTDTAFRAGAYAARLAHRRPPFVPGMEVAGTLEEFGPSTAADGLEIGDRVVGIVFHAAVNGAYAEQIALPVSHIARAPAGTTHVEAATLPMNGLTAWQALDALRLTSGQTVAVTGAAGAVGGYVMELARSERLRVIGDAAPDDVGLVRRLGADVVVPRGDGIATRICEVAPEGVHGLVDAAVIGEAVLPAVQDGGRVAALRARPLRPGRGITVVDVVVSERAPEPGRLDALCRSVESGVLTMRVARTFPAEEAAAAHRLLERGGTRGRIVLTF